MTFSIQFSAEEEARLAAAAKREGLEPEALLRKLVTDYLPVVEASWCASAVDYSKPPFRQDPRLVGVQFYENPVAGIDPEDWPEAFHQ